MKHHWIVQGHFHPAPSQRDIAAIVAKLDIFAAPGKSWACNTAEVVDPSKVEDLPALLDGSSGPF